LEQQVANIATAIGQMGHSTTLLSRLAALENEIAATTHQIEAHKAPELSVRIEEVRKFVASNIADIRNLLKDRPAGEAGAYQANWITDTDAQKDAKWSNLRGFRQLEPTAEQGCN
jgi:16S rRNA C1402 N4-methylase RsmH